jgi:hypothetical protein
LNRVYKSTLLEESSANIFDNTTATKTDFNELQRFGKSTGHFTEQDQNYEEDLLNNTASSGNRNAAAAVVARFKQSKAGQPAQGEHPRVWRICLSQGPLQKVSTNIIAVARIAIYYLSMCYKDCLFRFLLMVLYHITHCSPLFNCKAFEENPIRFDVENSTIDVVWRDSRTMINTTHRGEYSYNAKASTLRRERFHFNESYAGPGGLGKLCAYARHRVKRSVQTGRGIVFMCVAAGDGEGGGSSAQVEPPVSVVLGDCGGQGLISSVIESLFNHITPRSHPCKHSDKTLHRKYGGKNAPPVLGSSASLTEATNEPVLFSAVVLSEGSIIDLLGPSGSLVYQKGSNNPGKHQHRKCKVNRRANGAYYVAHMTRLQLHSVADFERVAGVLLGRRSALREMVPVLEEV